MIQPPPTATLFPYTTLFRSHRLSDAERIAHGEHDVAHFDRIGIAERDRFQVAGVDLEQREVARQFRSEEHTSELQSQFHLVCRLLLEKTKEPTISGLP